MSKSSLLFVYNANADLFSTVTDFAHKLLSPATYRCQLCALTYGYFTEKQEWKDFMDKLPMASVFLHKNEFIQKYTYAILLPAVFLQSGETLKQIISAAEIISCQTLPDLQNLVVQKLQSHGQHNHSHLQ